MSDNLDDGKVVPPRLEDVAEEVEVADAPPPEDDDEQPETGDPCRSRELVGLCPFHKKRTTSFTVNKDKSLFHCFGCGAHGDQLDFLAQRYNTDFKGVLEVAGALHREGLLRWAESIAGTV